MPACPRISRSSAGVLRHLGTPGCRGLCRAPETQSRRPDFLLEVRTKVPWHAHEASEEVLRCVAGSGTIYCGDVVKDS